MGNPSSISRDNYRYPFYLRNVANSRCERDVDIPLFQTEIYLSLAEVLHKSDRAPQYLGDQDQIASPLETRAVLVYQIDRPLGLDCSSQVD